MSHASGVPVSSALAESFKETLTTGNKRFLKVQVQMEPSEHLIEVASQPPRGSYEEDMALIPPMLEPKTPAFIVYRTDKRGTLGFEFLLLCYVPDACKAREKMLYSSTKAGLKQQLGGTNFMDTIHGTTPDDFSLKGFKQHMASQSTEAPLTEAEILKKEQKAHHSDFNMGTQYVHGVAFPVSDDALDKLQKLKNGSLSYVQLKIEEGAEKIILADSANISIAEMANHFPPKESRFHFFAYKHEHEGRKLNSIIFIYSNPNGTPVKQRMLYSTTKAAAAEAVTALGIEIARRLEVVNADELDEKSLYLELHPPKAEEKKAFSKPVMPGKGGRKLVK